MKKILLFLLALCFIFCNTNSAQSVETPTEVSFIYINGSNNLTYKNRLKFETAFIEDVNKLHPEIKKRFESDKTIQEHFLQNGKYTINPTPITFYWGNRSLDIVKTLDKDLEISSKYSPKIAHQARSLFAHCLHDAVWVQKRQNMASVINDLHEVINEELSKGKKVVLLGYSAGSFVTYQYYLNKANFIIPEEVMKGNYNAEVDEIINKNKVQPTCVDAIAEANLISYDPNIDRYFPNKDIEVFRKNYANLDNYTKQVCFNGGDVKGVVGFASPARLFYSDFIDETSSLSNITKLMGKSIIENDVFYLTVNYNNDPFGFANGENFTLETLQKESPLLKNIKLGKGFIYNKSDNYVPRTFVTAHLAYWQTPKRFAKAIVKAFNEGYFNFYGLKQDKK